MSLPGLTPPKTKLPTKVEAVEAAEVAATPKDASAPATPATVAPVTDVPAPTTTAAPTTAPPVVKPLAVPGLAPVQTRVSTAPTKPAIDTSAARRAVYDSARRARERGVSLDNTQVITEAAASLGVAPAELERTAGVDLRPYINPGDRDFRSLELDERDAEKASPGGIRAVTTNTVFTDPTYAFGGMAGKDHPAFKEFMREAEDFAERNPDVAQSLQGVDKTLTLADSKSKILSKLIRDKGASNPAALPPEEFDRLNKRALRLAVAMSVRGRDLPGGSFADLGLNFPQSALTGDTYEDYVREGRLGRAALTAVKDNPVHVIGLDTRNNLVIMEKTTADKVFKFDDLIMSAAIGAGQGAGKIATDIRRGKDISLTDIPYQVGRAMSMGEEPVERLGRTYGTLGERTARMLAKAAGADAEDVQDASTAGRMAGAAFGAAAGLGASLFAPGVGTDVVLPLSITGFSKGLSRFAPVRPTQPPVTAAAAFEAPPGEGAPIVTALESLTDKVARDAAAARLEEIGEALMTGNVERAAELERAPLTRGATGGSFRGDAPEAVALFDREDRNTLAITETMLGDAPARRLLTDQAWMPRVLDADQLVLKIGDKDVKPLRGLPGASGSVRRAAPATTQAESAAALYDFQGRLDILAATRKRVKELAAADALPVDSVGWRRLLRGVQGAPLSKEGDKRLLAAFRRPRGVSPEDEAKYDAAIDAIQKEIDDLITPGYAKDDAAPARIAEKAKRSLGAFRSLVDTEKTQRATLAAVRRQKAQAALAGRDRAKFVADADDVTRRGRLLGDVEVPADMVEPASLENYGDGTSKVTDLKVAKLKDGTWAILRGGPDDVGEQGEEVLASLAASDEAALVEAIAENTDPQDVLDALAPAQIQRLVASETAEEVLESALTPDAFMDTIRYAYDVIADMFDGVSVMPERVAKANEEITRRLLVDAPDVLRLWEPGFSIYSAVWRAKRAGVDPAQIDLAEAFTDDVIHAYTSYRINSTVIKRFDGLTPETVRETSLVALRTAVRIIEKQAAAKISVSAASDALDGLWASSLDIRRGVEAYRRDAQPDYDRKDWADWYDLPVAVFDALKRGDDAQVEAFIEASSSVVDGLRDISRDFRRARTKEERAAWLSDLRRRIYAMEKEIEAKRLDLSKAPEPEKPAEPGAAGTSTPVGTSAEVEDAKKIAANALARVAIKSESTWLDRAKAGKRGRKRILEVIRAARDKQGRARNRLGSNVALITDNDYDIAKHFIASIGTKRLEQVALAIEPTVRYRTGIFDNEPLGVNYMASQVIGISHLAISTGRFTSTVIHELWHTLSQFIPKDTLADMYRQFVMERAAFAAANPGAFDAAGRLRVINYVEGQSTYRYASFDEWVVEKMTDLSISDAVGKISVKRIREQGTKVFMSPGMQALRALRALAQSTYHQVETVHGADAVREAFLDFQSGLFLERLRDTSLAAISEVNEAERALQAKWTAFIADLAAGKPPEVAREDFVGATRDFLNSMAWRSPDRITGAEDTIDGGLDALEAADGTLFAKGAKKADVPAIKPPPEIVPVVPLAVNRPGAFVSVQFASPVDAAVYLWVSSDASPVTQKAIADFYKAATGRDLDIGEVSAHIAKITAAAKAEVAALKTLSKSVDKPTIVKIKPLVDYIEGTVFDGWKIASKERLALEGAGPALLALKDRLAANLTADQVVAKVNDHRDAAVRAFRNSKQGKRSIVIPGDTTEEIDAIAAAVDERLAVGGLTLRERYPNRGNKTYFVEERIQQDAIEVAPPAAKPAPAAKVQHPKMPKELASAPLRVGRVSVSFASDLDRAAYVLTRVKKPEDAAEYLKFFTGATGLDEAAARAHGAKVADAIKAQAAKAKDTTAFTLARVYDGNVVDAKAAATTTPAAVTQTPTPTPTPAVPDPDWWKSADAADLRAAFPALAALERPGVTFDRLMTVYAGKVKEATERLSKTKGKYEILVPSEALRADIEELARRAGLAPSSDTPAEVMEVKGRKGFLVRIVRADDKRAVMPAAVTPTPAVVTPTPAAAAAVVDDVDAPTVIAPARPTAPAPLPALLAPAAPFTFDFSKVNSKWWMSAKQSDLASLPFIDAVKKQAGMTSLDLLRVLQNHVDAAIDDLRSGQFWSYDSMSSPEQRRLLAEFARKAGLVVDESGADYFDLWSESKRYPINFSAPEVAAPTPKVPAATPSKVPATPTPPTPAAPPTPPAPPAPAAPRKAYQLVARIGVNGAGDVDVAEIFGKADLTDLRALYNRLTSVEAGKGDVDAADVPFDIAGDLAANERAAKALFSPLNARATSAPTSDEVSVSKAAEALDAFFAGVSDLHAQARKYRAARGEKEALAEIDEVIDATLMAAEIRGLAAYRAAAALRAGAATPLYGDVPEVRAVTKAVIDRPGFATKLRETVNKAGGGVNPSAPIARVAYGKGSVPLIVDTASTQRLRALARPMSGEVDKVLKANVKIAADAAPETHTILIRFQEEAVYYTPEKYEEILDRAVSEYAAAEQNARTRGKTGLNLNVALSNENKALGVELIERRAVEIPESVIGEDDEAIAAALAGGRPTWKPHEVSLDRMFRDVNGDVPPPNSAFVHAPVPVFGSRVLEPKVIPGIRSDLSSNEAIDVESVFPRATPRRRGASIATRSLTEAIDQALTAPFLLDGSGPSLVRNILRGLSLPIIGDAAARPFLRDPGPLRSFLAPLANEVEQGIGDMVVMLRQAPSGDLIFRYLSGEPGLVTPFGIPVSSSGRINAAENARATMTRLYEAFLAGGKDSPGAKVVEGFTYAGTDRPVTHAELLAGAVAAARAARKSGARFDVVDWMDATFDLPRSPKGTPPSKDVMGAATTAINNAISAITSARVISAGKDAAAGNQVVADVAPDFLRDLRKILLSQGETAMGRTPPTDLPLIDLLTDPDPDYNDPEQVRTLVNNLVGIIATSTLDDLAINRRAVNLVVHLASYAQAHHGIVRLSRTGVAISPDQHNLITRALNSEYLDEAERAEAERLVRVFGLTSGSDMERIDITGEDIYVPRSVAQILAQAFSKAKPIELAAFGRGVDAVAARGELIARSASTSVVRGNILLKNSKMVQDTVDGFFRVMTTTDPSVTARYTARTASAAIYGLIPGLAPMIQLARQKGQELDVVGRLADGGQAAATAINRYVGALSDTERAAFHGKVEDLLKVGMQRPSVLSVWRGENTVIPTATGQTTARELRDVAQQYGVLSSFDTSQRVEASLRDMFGMTYAEAQKNPTAAVQNMIGRIKGLSPHIAKELLRSPMEALEWTREVTSSTMEQFSSMERLSLFVTLLEDGFDPVSAARSTSAILYNYGRTVHGADRNLFVAVFLPFWAWRKNNNRSVLDLMFTQQGRVALMRARRAQSGIFGSAQSIIDAYTADEYGIDTEPMTPSQREMYYGMVGALEREHGYPLPVEQVAALRAVVSNQVGSTVQVGGDQYMISGRPDTGLTQLAAKFLRAGAGGNPRLAAPGRANERYLRNVRGRAQVRMLQVDPDTASPQKIAAMIMQETETAAMIATFVNVLGVIGMAATGILNSAMSVADSRPGGPDMPYAIAPSEMPFTATDAEMSPLWGNVISAWQGLTSPETDGMTRVPDEIGYLLASMGGDLVTIRRQPVAMEDPAAPVEMKEAYYVSTATWAAINLISMFALQDMKREFEQLAQTYKVVMEAGDKAAAATAFEAMITLLGYRIRSGADERLGTEGMDANSARRE